jgi:GNAT superfamily N-acetyltransferase
LPDVYGQALQRMQDAGQRLFVLEQDGRILGTLVLVIVPNLSHNTAPYAIIENVIVESALRSQGHGAQLIRHAVEEARRAGCYKVSLTSSKRRPDAHRFYERLGFTATHEGFRIDL